MSVCLSKSLTVCVSRSYAERETLIHIGERANSVFVLRRGMVVCDNKMMKAGELVGEVRTVTEWLVIHECLSCKGCVAIDRVPLTVPELAACIYSCSENQRESEHNVL